MLSNFFKLDELSSNVRTEVIRGPHDFRHDGLHHLRKPEDPVRRRNGRQRGLRRDLPRGGDRIGGDGTVG